MARLAGFVLLIAIAVALTTGSVASKAVVSKREGTIAFIRMVSGKVGGNRLFVVRPDGSGLRPVSPPGVWFSYAWSPDGSLIAYIDRHLSVWLVRPDGSGRRLLLPASRLHTLSLSWSPDGTRIAITTKCRKARCSRYGLYVVPISGRAPVRLPAGEHVGYGVSWSPNGDEIYYDNGGIWAIRPDGTGRRKISAVGSTGSLSPDGRQFAFGVAIHLKQGTDRYRAFAVVDADGRHFHVVTTHAYNEYGVAWSPNGRRILYGRAGSPSFYRFKSQGIWVIDPDSRNNHRITRDSPPQADWGALAWSPSGDSIVYDTGPYKNTDLYVIGADGRDKIHLTSGHGIDIDPTWVAG